MLRGWEGGKQGRWEVAKVRRAEDGRAKGMELMSFSACQPPGFYSFHL